jgi:hypothetical protein
MERINDEETRRRRDGGTENDGETVNDGNVSENQSIPVLDHDDED